MQLPSRTRATLLLGVGILLLAAPLYVGPMLHLDDSGTYQYTSHTVEFTNEGVNGSEIVGTIDPQVACLRRPAGRICTFENIVHSQNGIRFAKHKPVARAERYDYAYVDGDFHRPTRDRRNGTYYLTLEQVSRTEALLEVSTRYEDASKPIQKAIQSDSVTTHSRLEGANELVRYNGNYYVVDLQSTAESWPSPFLGSLVETGLVVIGFITGLVLVLKGQRARIETS